MIEKYYIIIMLTEHFAHFCASNMYRYQGQKKMEFKVFLLQHPYDTQFFSPYTQYSVTTVGKIHLIWKNMMTIQYISEPALKTYLLRLNFITHFQINYLIPQVQIL